jgi:hypothetical protein
MTKRDRIIELVREMIAVGNGGFTGSADPEGPVAGYDPLIKFKGKNKKVDFRKVPKIWRRWIKEK